jgi:hypothetical protein
MNVRYRVELSQAERGELTAMLSKGKRAARGEEDRERPARTYAQVSGRRHE